MDWGIVYYRTRGGDVPAEAFLDACPDSVEAHLLAVVEAVRESPPPKFSGGGLWEAMHGTMGGYYEVRTRGPGRKHYRLFCVLDNGSPRALAALGFDRPQIALITGMVKPNAALFTDAEYRRNVRTLGDDYRSTSPRRVAT